MPKRRVPSHRQRTGRRRRDSAPNPSPALRREAPPTNENPEAAASAAAEWLPSRQLRPTLRGAGATRFVRTQQPTIDLTTEYRHIVNDLRQIGLLAAIAFLILGALAIAIR